jgi:probable addiction module antidote protein
MVMKVSDLPKFDAAEFLDNPEVISAYLDEAFASEDAGVITQALGTVARAKGMTEVARNSGLSRESLYKALSADGNPEFATIVKVLQALGLRFTATAA